MNRIIDISVATIQLKPSQLSEEDLRLPKEDFLRLQHFNERAELGKIFIHKAKMVERLKYGGGNQGLLQSAMYDSDKGTGRDELRELLDAIKTTCLERFYPPVIE